MKSLGLKRRFRIKNIFVFLVVLYFAFQFFSVFALLDLNNIKGVAKYYLENDIKDTESANVVTSIVVNYRGFDTLGEVTVLFLAATGLAAILSGERKKKRKKMPANAMLQYGSKPLLAIVVLFGAYIFIHGHLSPGGGFQGGTVIATGFLMMLLAFEGYEIKHGYVKWAESLAGLTFVTVGLFGLFLLGSFLANFLPLGKVGELFSAGVIPIIYVAVGFKVGSELTGLLDNMMGVVE